MELATTFRHMKPSDAVSQCTRDKLERLRKYFQGNPINSHAVFSVDKGHSHTADISVTLPNGLVVQGKETSEDMYCSVDIAVSRIESQVRKWKDKIRDHKPHGGPSHAFPHHVVTGRRSGNVAPTRPSAEADHGSSAAPTAPKPTQGHIVKESDYEVRSMKVDDAILQLNLIQNDFFVFSNVDNRTISIVYRRSDGDFGHIETGGQLT